jgi:hypothetical protein
MKTPKTKGTAEEPVQETGNLPFYNPHVGNESGFNYRSVEIKSHSFSVRNASHLAAENIIFEPEAFSDTAE